MWRLSVKRLMARYGPDASIRDIMHERSGVPAPERHADMRPLRPLLPALAQLFGPPETD